MMRTSDRDTSAVAKRKAKSPPGVSPSGPIQSVLWAAAQDSAVSRVARWLASQARMTVSTSSEWRVFSQSLSRISSHDGPDKIGEAATARLSFSRSAGNSYSIDALHSASGYFDDRLRQVTRTPNHDKTRLPISGIGQSKHTFGSNESTGNSFRSDNRC